MSTSPNRAPQSPGKGRRKDGNIDLQTARQMLPLVKSIVNDIVRSTDRLQQLEPEQATLEEHRRALTWTSRQRRYSITDEINEALTNRTIAVAELDALGVALVDPSAGEVDFPTRINGRPAAFSWQLGEDAVDHWRYSGETQRRPIPSDWQSGTPLRFRADA